MSKHYLVSVVMSCYNEPLSYIKDSIESILNQSYENIQLIIVIDKPERNDIYDCIKEYSLTDSRVHLLVNEKNEGLVYSLNRALKHATGEFIARMDADDISMPKRIENELNYLLYFDYDLVASNISNIDMHGKLILDSTLFPFNTKHIVNYYKYGVCLSHPTWLAKKDVFINNGGYRNFLACEDYDFVTRCILNGYSVGLLNSAQLKYRINYSGVSQTRKAIQKCSFLYLSHFYKKGAIVDINDYNNYLNSSKGKRTIKQLESYYNMRTNSNYPIFVSVLYSLISKSVRKLAINEIKIKTKFYRFS